MIRWPWSRARALEQLADQHAMEVMQARADAARYVVDRLLKGAGGNKYALRYPRTDRNKVEQIIREAINGGPNHGGVVGRIG